MAFRVEFFATGRRRLGSIAPPASSPPPKRRPEGASGDAVLRWGRPSSFQMSTGSGGGFTQPRIDILPSGDDEAANDEALGLIFTETARLTTTVRISNPLDAADFVDVEQIDRISFRGPDGVIRTFVLSN